TYQAAPRRPVYYCPVKPKSLTRAFQPRASLASRRLDTASLQRRDEHGQQRNEEQDWCDACAPSSVGGEKCSHRRGVCPRFARVIACAGKAEKWTPKCALGLRRNVLHSAR